MISLQQLYRLHDGKVSIKWAHYLGAYERIFCGLRERPVRLLEIGVQNGGSLEIWGKYFGQGTLFVGCDSNPQCATLDYGDARIRLVSGDANAASVRAAILDQAGSYSIVIDDGSHLSGDVIRSFVHYFGQLEAGGVYIIEDLHASYWQEYQGGLYCPHAAMSFFKRLADVINQAAWKNAKSADSYLGETFRQLSITPEPDLLAGVHSVEFTNSMCIIRKDGPENNALGALVVAGKHAAIAPECLQAGFHIAFPDQTGNPWSNLALAPDESYASDRRKTRQLEIALHAREQDLAQRNQQVQALQASLDALQDSRSWRLTRPLRYLARLAAQWRLL